MHSETKTNTQPSLGLVIIGLIILMLVNMCLSASAQTTVLSEDFEGVTSSWQFVTNSGNGNNYWEVSNGSCSNGTNLLMVRRNTNACTYRNNNAHNITARRQVNATGYQNLTLAFDWVCNGQAGVDYGSVYYSFNGTIWTQITDGGNNGQYQGTTTWSSQSAYNLPSVLDDTTFYIGFNWVNNNSGGSYPAFGIDNVVIQGTVVPATPPTAPASGIFSENFSGGSLPAGWGNTDVTGNNAGTWRFNNPGGRTISTTTSANGFAIFDSDNLGQDNKVENAELVSPAFDCSDYAIVTLELSHYFRFYANSDYRISISGDNGASYNTLVFDSANTANAANFSADISAYAAGNSQVRLKFTYRGHYSWYWAIDDILVEGQMADSATWTGAVSTAWNTASNWSPSSVPTTATSILIPASAVRMPTVGSSIGAGAFNVTIENGATLTIATDSTQGGSLTITGDLICNGAIEHTGNALVKLSGAGRVISGNYTGGANDEYWEFQSGASYTLNGNFTTYGVRIADGASLDLNGYNLSVYEFQQYGSLSLGASTLEIGGNNNVFTTSTFNSGTGTVHFNSGGTTWATKPVVSQTVPSATYYNLQVRTNNGYTATLGTGTAFQVSNDLTILNPGTSGGVANTGANITVMGNFVVGSGITNGLTLNVGHRIIGNGSASSLILAGSASINQINITYTDNTLAAIDNFEGSSTVINYPIAFTGTGTQMVFPIAYNSLSIGGTGNKALGADIAVGGNLTLGSGTLTTAISMITEKVSASSDVFVNYFNGGVATNNTAPTLASLIANASSMTINIPAGYSNYAIAGIQTSIAHTYNADLDIYLASPTGTVYVISTDNGGNGDGYIDARFSDSGSGTYPNNAVLNGHYTPEGFTFASIGGSKTGVWTLYVIDDASGDDGTITDFKLQLRSSSTYGNITLAGNWNNTNGTFTAGNGLVTFSGSSQQSISSRGQAFYQLSINNAAGVLLNDDVTVGNVLTLSNGVVTTGANRLIMTSTTTAHLAGYSSAAFINGNLRRYIGYNTQTYALPVGNGTGSGNYRLAELENNLLLGVSYLDASFEALANHNDAQLNVSEGGLDITRINPSGIWVIEPNSQPILGSYSIKLHLAGFNGLTDNAFVVLKRPVGSTSGADWGTGNGLLNLLNGLGRLLSDGFALRTGLTSFSEFGIGDGSSGGSSLPIELIAFTAKLTDDAQVQLDWATAIEIENDYFTIERSADGVDFEPIATIKGAGNSTRENRYTAMDTKPLDGLSYYRLKQTDFNGTYTYSPIRSVVMARGETETEAIVTVYPNPSNGSFNVLLTGISGQADVRVTDMQGRVVHAQSINITEYDGPLSLNLADKLLPGYYQVSVVGNSASAIQKIIVQQ